MFSDDCVVCFFVGLINLMPKNVSGTGSPSAAQVCTSQ